MLRFGFLVSSAAVETASKPTYAKKIDAAAPSTPTPDSGVPQPFGSIGTKFAWFTAGSARMMNAVSATILTMTSSAVTFADFEVPSTSSQVISSESRKAMRLNVPRTVVPSASVTVSPGPAVSATGNGMPMALRNPFAYPDQPTATAPAATAYSSTSAQPTIQAMSSPSTA